MKVFVCSLYFQEACEARATSLVIKINIDAFDLLLLIYLVINEHACLACFLT